VKKLIAIGLGAIAGLAERSHFIMMEKPREFSAAVLVFLQANQWLPNRS